MKAPRWLSYVAFPLFIAAILALIWVFRQNFVEAFRDREAIRSWILARGAWGMLAFVGIQALQVILFMLPGEIVQVAGGYAFGLWLGSALSLVGITLGSLVNFWVGRVLGRPSWSPSSARRRWEGSSASPPPARARRASSSSSSCPAFPRTPSAMSQA